MKTVTIKPAPEGARYGTRVINEDGADIPGVLSLAVTFEPGNFATATVVLMADMDEANAELLFDRDTLERSAAALGLKLVEA